MGIWKKIKEFFIGRPRPIYEMKITPEQMKRIVNRNVQIKLGDLQAQIANLKKENVSLKQSLEGVKTEEERRVVRQLNKRNEELRKERRNKKAAILFDTEKPLFLRSVIKKQFFKKGKFLRGFEFEDTNYGPKLNFVVSPNKKGYKKLRPVKGTLLKNMKDLIYDPQSFVTNLKSRNVVVNVTPDERFIPQIKTQIPMPEPLVANGNNETIQPTGEIEMKPDVKKMMEIDMKKIADESPEAATIISGLYSQINNLIAEKQNAEEREQEAVADKIEAESTVRSLMKGLDRSKSMLDSALDKLDSAYSRLGTAELTEQDMRLKATLAEALVIRVMAALDRLAERAESEESRTAVMKAKDEIKDDFDFALQRLAGFPIPEEKEEEVEKPKIRKVSP